MSPSPRALGGSARPGGLPGGVLLGRHPLEPPILVRGTLAGLALAMIVLVIGWPVAAATPWDAEVGVVTGLAVDPAHGLRSIAQILSHAGHLLTIVVVAVVASLVARWRWGGWQVGLLLFTVLAGASVITGAVKLLTARIRPGETVVETMSSAFPSGHAVRAAAVYGLLAWLVARVVRRRWLRGALVVLLSGAIVLTAVARLVLSAHWPTDVLVGVLLGAAWLAVSLWLLRPRTSRCPGPAHRGRR